MWGRIVKPDRLIVVRPTFLDVSCTHQGSAHQAVPNHERNRRSLLFGELQELRCEVAQSSAAECHIVPDPETVNDREQEQRIFGRLSERNSSFDIQACLT